MILKDGGRDVDMADMVDMANKVNKVDTVEGREQDNAENQAEGRPRSATVSSARRRPQRRRIVAAWSLLAVVLLLLLGVSVELRRRAYRPLPPVPTPTRAPSPLPTATLTPTPTATATPTLISTAWLVVSAPTVPPTPRPTPRPTRRRGPQPTPTIAECVEFTWNASHNRAALGQVLVDIDVRNRCQRQLEPLEVWFWVGGYRDGALAGSTSGHLYDPVRPNDIEQVLIALPGSLTWFDHIEVHLIKPGASVPP